MVELAGFLCFSSIQMDNLYNFPCFDLSCPHYQVVGTNYLPIPPSTDFGKKSPLWNLQIESIFSHCCCWVGPYEMRQLQPGLPPSHPPCQTSQSCQHHYLCDEAPPVSTGMPCEDQECPIRDQLMGGGRRTQDRVFYFTWNYENHEMVLSVLWIR